METFDVFVEQLVTRNMKKTEFMLKMALFAVCGLFAGVVLLVGLFNPPLMAPLVLVIAGVIYLAYYVGGKFNVEFEYCLTNGLFDVDTIVNMKNRKRIADFECKQVVEFGKLDANRNYNCAKTVFAANSDAENLYYFIYNSKEDGKILLVIEPNEKMLNGLKRCLPRQLTLNIL